jgi:PKD repeat protein
LKGVFLFIIFFNLTASLLAQDDLCRKSTEGTEFWFGFMESRNYHNQHFVEITVTARETTNFQVFTGKDETPFNGTYTVQANNRVRIEIPWQLVEATGSEEIQDKGIRLVSEKPVNVYALNWDRNSADVAVIYPVASLGNEYFAICYEPHIHENNGNYGNGRNSQFLIVATTDLTKVLIVPSKVTDKQVSAGDTIEVVLNKGEVFQVQSMNRDNLPGQGDLTGSYILADKPVAFYSGSLATTVPAQTGVSAWDHLYEQIPPIHSWGREYYVVPLKSREQDLYRIMAAHDNTIVYIDGLSPFELNRGEFKELVLYHNQPKRIFSEKPLLVVQYSQSQSVDKEYTGGNGDPFMIVLSSVTQSKNDVTFVAYDSDQIQKYYVNIVTLTEETGNILFDGDHIQNEFTPFSGSNYSWAQLSIGPGTYRIFNTKEDRGFLAYVYGFGGVESYGYGVGFNLNLVLDLGKSIDFNGDTLLLCYGDSRTLDAGPYFDTYTWNTGDSGQTLTVNQPGRYRVKVTTIDGCELEDSIYLYVSHPETELGIETDQGCEPYSVELDANDGFTGYLWQNEQGDTLSTFQKFTAAQTGEFRVTVWDQYGCPARDTMQMEVFPVPGTKISGPELVCGEKSAHLSVSISGASESVWNYPASFEWNTDKASPLIFSNESHTSVNIEAKEWGSYKVYYQLKTTDGCIKRDTFFIRFHPQPNSDFTFENDEKCEGYSKKLRFNGAATDSATFFWDLDGCRFVDTLGWQNYQVSLGAFLENPPHISLFINDNGCYSDTTIKPLGAKPNFTMMASPTRGCDELTVGFSGKLLVEDNVEFNWEFDDGTSSQNQNVTKYYTEAGFYSASLTITNPVTQCQNSFTIDSMVKVFPTPVATISADSRFCYTDSILIYYPQNTDSSFCSWEFDGIYQTGTGNDSINVIIEKPVGTVRLVVNEFGCLSNPLEMQLKRKPHFDFSAEHVEDCQPFVTEVFADPEDEHLDFYWIADSISSATGQSGLIVFPDSGRFDVGLITISSETGCTDTLIKEDWIWVHPKPEAVFDVDYPVALIENARITFTNQSESADIFFWDFGDGNSSSGRDAVHTYTELGEYTSSLFAESEYGCKDTTATLITILPFSVYTPNAFRPDSPIEKNRTFMPVGAGADLSRFKLEIFDRNGHRVFQTHSPEEAWDGTTPNGSPAPMGNYVWISRYFDIQGFKHEQKGQVLLIR